MSFERYTGGEAHGTIPLRMGQSEPSTDNPTLSPHPTLALSKTCSPLSHQRMQSPSKLLVRIPSAFQPTICLSPPRNRLSWPSLGTLPSQLGRQLRLSKIAVGGQTAHSPLYLPHYAASPQIMTSSYLRRPEQVRVSSQATLTIPFSGSGAPHSCLHSDVCSCTAEKQLNSIRRILYLSGLTWVTIASEKATRSMSKVVSYPEEDGPTNTPLRHLAQYTRLRNVGHVDEDVVRRVAVQRRTQALLVQVVSNETDRTTEDEETVQSADLKAQHIE